MPHPSRPSDAFWMRQALALARRGIGRTSPNPMVGAVLVRDDHPIGRGWHRRAGLPHAEVEAIEDARRHGNDPAGATLYVTLEPCSTQGRTPPCTAAIGAAGLRRVVVAATDPNPRHQGRGVHLLREAGVEVTDGILADEASRMNEAFNHWIVQGTPFVTVKAAMTLDGKIATASGESKWITGARSRAVGMRLRRAADAILVGVNTVLADDPSLTVRTAASGRAPEREVAAPRRLILDSRARTPLTARLITDRWSSRTTVVVSGKAPGTRVRALADRVEVLTTPPKDGEDINVRWLLARLGRQDRITSLLVEGGGEANATFLLQGLAQRVAFFYAPMVIGGREARRSVAGRGAVGEEQASHLGPMEWRRLGSDLYLTARITTGVGV